MKSAARWGLRIFFGFLALLLLVVLTHAMWTRSARGRLERLVAGYRAAGEPTTLDDLAQPHVPDDQNAVIELRAAYAALDTTSEDYLRYDKTERALPLTNKERAAVLTYLAKSAPSLALIEAP